MTTPRLLHMGGAVVDLVYRAQALPAQGSEVVAETFARIPGGGFNTMLSAARCGMAVAYGGPHGAGPQGDFMRAALTEAGIAVLQPVSPALDTGNCVVIVTPDGERTFLSWPGAESHVTDEALEAIRPSASDHVLVSGYTLSYPTSRAALARWLEHIDPSVAVVFDPAPVVASIPQDILRTALNHTTWLSANAAEARFLTGASEPAEQIAGLLGDLCPRAQGVVLRTGSDGAWLGMPGEPARHVPSFEVEVHDTNGAGDTHLGAFVTALSRGEPPLEAVRFANAAAAISVTRAGGSSAPFLPEINDFLEARAVRAR
jgi:sugar/nucleoside kinase (ribokinase family)